MSLSSAANAASQQVHDDIDLVVLPAAAWAAQEAKACGKDELSTKVTQAFTALVTAAGYEESYASQLLKYEFDRCCRSAPMQCDETDLAKQIHYVDVFSKAALADIAAGR
jgi:hypothetical protein